MKALIFLALCVSFSFSAHAADVRCQKQVERDNSTLAKNTHAWAADKARFAAAIDAGATTMTDNEIDQALNLLNKESTIAFSIMNDTGLWLVLADADSCETLETFQFSAP